jgi:RNA polymerase sigma-70 factor, ECF subfamily
VTLFPDEVVAGVKAGDPDAIGAVYVRLADRLLGFIMARVRDRGAAEDLLEATFVELLQKGSTITGGAAAIKVWLFRAAHYNALDHLRKRTRLREDFGGDLFDIDLAAAERGPAEQAIAASIADDVHEAMGELSEEQRQVLVLRYIGGLSSREVAEIMDKNDGAVRSLQLRGERQLARLLHRLRPPAPSAPDRTSEDHDV